MSGRAKRSKTKDTEKETTSFSEVLEQMPLAEGAHVGCKTYGDLQKKALQLREELDALCDVALANKMRVVIGLNRDGLAVIGRKEPQTVIRPIYVEGSFSLGE